MTDAPRGSAAYWNNVLKNCTERAKDMTNHLVEMVGQSGYPPLTVPITLRDLKKMPPEIAVAMLREELGRTTTVDPATGEPRVDPKTLSLVTSYLSAQRDEAGAVRNG